VARRWRAMSQAVPKRSHHAKPLADDAARVKASNTSIKDFFSPPPKPGRPPGLPPKKRGRPAAPTPEAASTAATPSSGATTATPATAASAAAPLPRAVEPQSGSGKRAAAALVGVKLKRVNYGKGEGLKLLTKAISDWDNKTGIYLEADSRMAMPQFAKLVGIPYNTFLSYACAEVGKRKALGSSVGNKPLFNAEQQQFAADVIRRCILLRRSPMCCSSLRRQCSPCQVRTHWWAKRRAHPQMRRARPQMRRALRMAIPLIWMRMSLRKSARCGSRAAISDES
jgi:hypothetical protein